MALLTLIATTSPYAFLLETGAVASACELPVASDDRRDVFVPITLLAGLLPLGIGIWRRLSLAWGVGALLMLWWGYRVFLSAGMC